MGVDGHACARTVETTLLHPSLDLLSTIEKKQNVRTLDKRGHYSHLELLSLLLFNRSKLKRKQSEQLTRVQAGLVSGRAYEVRREPRDHGHSSQGRNVSPSSVRAELLSAAAFFKHCSLNHLQSQEPKAEGSKVRAASLFSNPGFVPPPPPPH